MRCAICDQEIEITSDGWDTGHMNVLLDYATWEDRFDPRWDEDAEFCEDCCPLCQERKQ